MTKEQAMTSAEGAAYARERAMTAAGWLAFFAHTDHEDDAEVPGPYEQGANSRVVAAQFDEYWD